MPEMDLTQFRTNLTDLVNALGDTGPLRLTRYGNTVAEIRSATPEAEKAYAERIVETVRLLDELEITDRLFTFGLGNIGDMIELAQRYRQFKNGGMGFGFARYSLLPDHGPLTIDQVLAYLYFGEDVPSTGDICEWFRVCVRLREAARERGVSAEMFHQESLGDTPIMEVVVEAGHTPESFAALALRALDDGVGLDRLGSLLDERAIPNDVLALPGFADYMFNELTAAGLPHSETVAFFRLGLDYRLALGFTEAGVRTAEEIKTLIDNKVDVELAQRAARDGIPVEQWRIQVPRLQQLRYRGNGVLPFAVLVQAADENVPVTRWDNNKLALDTDRHKGTWTPTREKRLASYPWRHIYPDHVIDVARAGLSPSFITAFGKLMWHFFGDTVPGFADAAITAYNKGLTVEVANAISRADSKKRPKFTPSQLYAILDEGLRDPATAHVLADLYSDHEGWIADMRERKNRQATTTEFLFTIADTPSWDAVRAVAFFLTSDHWAKKSMRGEVYTNATIDDLLNDEILDDRQIVTLLTLTRSRLKDRYTPSEITEPFAAQVGEIEDLLKLFFDMFKTPEPESDKEDKPEGLQNFMAAVEYLAKEKVDE